MEENDLGISKELLEEVLKNSGYSIDKIARMLMIELIKVKRAEFILLRDDTISKWWTSEVNTANKRIAVRTERARVARIKRQAIAKLTADERRALGIRVTKSMKEVIDTDQEA